MKNTFRIVSLFEGLSFLLLLFVAVPFKYLAGNESLVKLLGMPHGILFIAYVVFALFLKWQLKWSNKTFIIIGIASLIPFGTFYTDKKYLRD